MKQGPGGILDRCRTDRRYAGIGEDCGSIRPQTTVHVTCSVVGLIMVTTNSHTAVACETENTVYLLLYSYEHSEIELRRRWPGQCCTVENVSPPYAGGAFAQTRETSSMSARVGSCVLRPTGGRDHTGTKDPALVGGRGCGCGCGCGCGYRDHDRDRDRTVLFIHTRD